MKNRNASIVNLSSVTGPMVADSGEVAYATTKAAVLGFTKSLAAELVEDKIRVNAIAPGFIQTDMTDALSEQVKEATLKNIPMKRLGQVNEVAQVALFLASDLSSYVTGEVVRVDGGMAM